ncbi:MAG: RDD family protein [Coriobacteriia bacterium]
MTVSLGRFEVTGPADAGRYRAASIIDFAAAALLAMLVFPFPVVRATVATPVFVVLIIAAIVVAHIVYLSVVLSVWGRTPGMYLLDLGIAGGRIPPVRALAWGFGAVLEFLPRVAGVRPRGANGGLASRISGLELASTAGPGGTQA